MVCLYDQDVIRILLHCSHGGTWAIVNFKSVPICTNALSPISFLPDVFVVDRGIFPEGQIKNHVIAIPVILNFNLNVPKNIHALVCQRYVMGSDTVKAHMMMNNLVKWRVPTLAFILVPVSDVKTRTLQYYTRFQKR